jgi:hypothetical protein
MSFQVDKYARQAAPVRYDDLDLDTAFRDRPLSPDTLRVLRYMCDIESHTICYLRDVLVTPSHTDPEVTTFLTMWNYEEYWHGPRSCPASPYRRPGTSRSMPPRPGLDSAPASELGG